jgi:hypothetical protein
MSPEAIESTLEQGLSPAELEEEVALDLPDREALSLAFPLAVASTPNLAVKGTVAAVAEEAPVEEVAQ